MPIIRPFRALRYGHDHLPELDALVSPSHVGQPGEGGEVGDVHPNSIRQLIRGDFGSLAEPDEPRFSHAQRLLGQWKADGVLVRDPRPNLYILEERWEGGSRRGLVALVRLPDSSESELLPHEDVTEQSETNLSAQLEMLETQLSLVMGVLPDREGALASFLSEERGDPDYWAVDGRDLKSGVWRESDPGRQLELIESLRNEVTVIADGHHRFRAACAWRKKKVESGAVVTRETPSSYVMMLLFPAANSGLACEASHRVCSSLAPGPRAELEEALNDFERTELSSAEDLRAYLRSDDGPRYGMVLDGKIAGLRPKPGLELPLPSPLSTVETAVLSALLVDRLDKAISDSWKDMTTSCSSGSPFSHNHTDSSSVLEAAVRGDIDLALFTRPPTALQVMEVAAAGQRLPAKSTNFRPKPTKGLLMASMRSF